MAARGDQSGMWGTTAGQRFGVRSYLHLFYEDCAFSQPEEDPEEPEGTLSSWASSHPLLWRASLTTGILVLLMGVVALGTGLLVPPMIEGFGEGELQVVDQQAIEYNQALERCALAGGILLTLGGTALLACVLICPLRRVLEKPKEQELAAFSKVHCAAASSIQCGALYKELAAFSIVHCAAASSIQCGALYKELAAFSIEHCTAASSIQCGSFSLKSWQPSP
ncbi:neurensin-1-like [Huso huso]|uniref:Neurensin-1-like n=1 Tax=Huso huso TaxID=61971 RepID=A0ABR0Z3Y9_HUSHU